jgi:hypothetical protein
MPFAAENCDKSNQAAVMIIGREGHDLPPLNSAPGHRRALTGQGNKRPVTMMATVLASR